MPFDPSLAAFDRDVARADAAWQSWRARLSAAPDAARNEDPFAAWRHVAGKNALDAIDALSPVQAELPWKEALSRWAFALTQRRVSADLRIAWELAAHEKSAHLTLDRPREVSYLEAWDQMLEETEPARAEAWLAAAASRGPALAAVVREAAQRRLEVAHRVGLAHPFALATKMSLDALRGAARAVLRATEDVALQLRREVGGGGPRAVAGLLLALGRDAPEGWPSRLTTRWLEDLFGALAKGLPLNVAVPRALGASSFARALGAFGHAFRVAGVSRSLPFALARDPYVVDAHRFALVFASLPSSPAFQRRALHNASRVAQDQARRLARCSLFEARAIAVRALLADDEAVAGGDLFEELTGSLFGAPFPEGLAGAWPRPRGDEWTRLLALLSVAPFAEELVDRFDIDWFENPRAVSYLRDRASAPAREPADAEPLDAAAAAKHLAVRFEGARG